MNGISLTEPWAHLMAIGEKHYETRGWSTAYRGELAIAAAKKFPHECQALCVKNPPFTDALVRHDITTLRPMVEAGGLILAVVEVVDCVPTTAEGCKKRLARAPAVPPAEFEAAFGDYSPRRFAIVTTNLRRLARPVPVAHIERGISKPGGARGIFDLPEETIAAVRAELAGAALEVA